MIEIEVLQNLVDLLDATMLLNMPPTTIMVANDGVVMFIVDTHVVVSSGLARLTSFVLNKRLVIELTLLQMVDK